MSSVRRDFFLFLVMLVHTLLASGLFVEPCVDWSSAGLSTSSHEYKDHELQTMPLEELYANAGIMTVRQRLWVQRGNSGDYSLGFNIGLFKRAKAAGIKRLYLDVFLSDTWFDPAQTRGPAVWTSMIREQGVSGMRRDRDRRMIRGKVSERGYGRGAKTGRGMRRDTNKRRDRRPISAPIRKPHARQGQGRSGRH